MKNISELLKRRYVPTLVERFVSYVRTPTTSDRHIDDIPSTPEQWVLAHTLQSELQRIGVPEVTLDDHCYLVGRLPASRGCESKPCIGFMAHLDTASDVSGTGVNPRVVEGYDGRAIQLSPEWVLDPLDHEELTAHHGDTLVVTDGTTLLGADDKAGIAEIMTAMEFLIQHPEIEHGPVEIIFTPDEETGKGMSRFPVQSLKSAACYTIDGGKSPEVEAECFTAYSVRAEFTGKAIHIGSARGKLANAASMAASFVSMLPRSESPESTDGWYGYYCPIEISGGIEHAVADVYLRDFTDEGMSRRIDVVKALARAVEGQFPLGNVHLDIKKQYLNMRHKMDERPEVLAKLVSAVTRAGAEAEITPIRGGTDGSRLTEMGIPTPNIFTGGHNAHSRFEWASVAEMALAVDTIIELVQLWSE